MLDGLRCFLFCNSVLCVPCNIVTSVLRPLISSGHWHFVGKLCMMKIDICEFDMHFSAAERNLTIDDLTDERISRVLELSQVSRSNNNNNNVANLIRLCN
jgi:hypothetical protein